MASDLKHELERQSSTELLDLLGEVLDSSFSESVEIHDLFGETSSSTSSTLEDPQTYPKAASQELSTSSKTTTMKSDADIKAEQEARRRYVAAASRRARVKRKTEYEQMSLRTLELEQEQDEFQKEIATLQNEIQTLKRCRGELRHRDLRMENQLLRAEVKRYKAFVDVLNQSVRSLPSYTREEKLRLARTGVESSVGQMLGLGYTSIRDDSWKFVYAPIPADINGVAPGQNVYIKYQYLPHGSSRDSAKRVNLRTDVFAVEGTPKLLANRMWTAINSEDFIQRFASIQNFDGIQFSWKPIDDFFEDSYQEGIVNGAVSSFGEQKDERIKVYKYAEEIDDGTRHDSICIISYDSVVFSADGFPNCAGKLKENVCEDAVSPEDVPGYVITLTVAHPGVEKLVAEKPGFRRVRGSLYEGYIIQESKIPGMSVVSSIASTPIETGSLALMDPSFIHPIDPNGTISEMYMQIIFQEFKILATGSK
mmetsp:Transcript_9578/g.12423  ORF Transcript_9578/g.12423 Transcript_9578/m.12423 type:complete len:481 (+) Transcript_9578:320-1762(+)|eukprot:CAMPEP_0204870886 /NCGR_PEP_ID=MMETSP1348-20121228/33917_1 /ASSEMBLY_ACC=CAM_ASM_000700 /TAXON_ID=215587 /ORGANISM="Aplanochytrium stocchinoi, Strain GSBS06" /LENGTH=480 /DNA_ID=CAMNT_0052024947 /DNA_START=290 /DNA_END=1735 /DNA_ORIENTATION=-